MSASGNVSPMSAVVTVTTPNLPNPPSTVSVTPTSGTGMSLSWSGANGTLAIGNYFIYRGASSTGLVQIGASTTTQFLDQSLLAGAMYYYAIAAADTAGDVSPLSAVVSAATYPLPAAPAGVTATAKSATQISVNWSASSSGLAIARYYVLRGSTAGSLTQVAIVNGTSYQDTAVNPGSTYYYAINAVDTANDVSTLSAAAQATTYVAPEPPTGEAAAANSDAAISLTWTARATPAGGLPVARFNIYQGSSASGSIFADRP